MAYYDNTPLNTQAINDTSLTPTIEKGRGGEIIELQKRHYDNAFISGLLDNGFSEVINIKDKMTVDAFFVLYQDLFFNIPKEGTKKSHTFLIEESTNYVGGYEDPKDDKINALIAQLVEIETGLLKTPSEHPLFKNGTIVRRSDGKGSIWIMQEGHARNIAKDVMFGLRRTLGLVNHSTGELLSEIDCYTFVSTATMNSLPKWPEGTAMHDVADWSITLNQFNIAASNITILTENIKQSELDEYELKSLIRLLRKKEPFLGNTIEDRGNETYTTAELAPFGEKGTEQGQTNIWYKGGIWGGAGEKSPAALIDGLVAKYEAEAKKGIYGLGNLVKTEEVKVGTKNVYNPLSIDPWKKEDVFKTHINVIRHEEDYKSSLIEELEELRAEVMGEDERWIYYNWNIDTSRDTATIVGGMTTISGKLFWVRVEQQKLENYISQLINMAIGAHKAKYENYEALLKIKNYTPPPPPPPERPTGWVSPLPWPLNNFERTMPRPLSGKIRGVKLMPHWPPNKPWPPRSDTH